MSLFDWFRRWRKDETVSLAPDPAPVPVTPPALAMTLPPEPEPETLPLTLAAPEPDPAQEAADEDLLLKAFEEAEILAAPVDNLTAGLEEIDTTGVLQQANQVLALARAF